MTQAVPLLAAVMASGTVMISVGPTFKVYVAILLALFNSLIVFCGSMTTRSVWLPATAFQVTVMLVVAPGSRLTGLVDNMVPSRLTWTGTFVAPFVP